MICVTIYNKNHMHIKSIKILNEDKDPCWKAKYWACKTWSNKPVSKMVGENKKK